MQSGGYIARFAAAMALLLSTAFVPVLAADQSGKLWIERNPPPKKTVRKKAKKRAPKPVAKPVDQSVYRPASTPDIGKDRKKTLQRARPAARAQGSGSISRSTLPPLQNAPVDRNYGADRDYGAERRDEGRPGDRRDPYSRGGRFAPARLPSQRLPARLWESMSFEQFRTQVLKLDGRGGSRVLNNLFARALVDRRSTPSRADPQTLDLLRMVVLYRMGRIADLGAFIKQVPPRNRSMPVKIFQARAFLAGGDFEQACKLASAFPVGDPALSKQLLSEALMMTALCAAHKNDLQTMGLIADLARDRGIGSPLSFAVIDYLQSGVRPRVKIPARLGVRDYYFLRLLKAKMPGDVLQKADPALVYALAFDRSAAVGLRLAAAEKAASKGQIDARALAAVYRDAVAHKSARENSSDALIRARLFDGVSRTSDPLHRAKIIDTLLANTRGRHLSRVIAPLLAPYVASIEPSRGLEAFAMRAIEVALLSGNVQLAERWYLFVKQGGRAAYIAAEWLPLTDLVQRDLVPAGEGTQMAMRMARARRLDGGALHRLTSVLDALAFDVSIPLWNMAGKHPQPHKGALPATGVLSRLKKLADEGRPGEVLLMALQTVGPHSADKLHLIALGDIVRALKKAKFGKAAGRFAFNALYGIWPTGARSSR